MSGPSSTLRAQPTPSCASGRRRATRPTRSRPNLSRDAEWLEPLSLVSPLETDALGVYFEVYGSEVSVPWYRLCAEVVDRETGVVTGVPIRPAGEEGFRPTWDRFPEKGGLTSEFLTVSLSDVDRSRHTLRIIVDVPEVGARIVAQRDVDRREP